MYYFAYGSNLSHRQMSNRLRLKAKPIERITVCDWQLVFRETADIIPLQGHRVEGVVYKISRQDMKILDWFEGVPVHYRKIYLPYNQSRMLCYQMTSTKFGMPNREYLSRIIQGYRKYEIPLEILLDALLFTQHLVDQFKEQNNVIR